MKVRYLALESLLLYLLPPLLVILGIVPKIAVMPLLWLGMIYALFMLRSGGNGRMLWHIDRGPLRHILLRFALLGSILGVTVRILFPELLFAFPRAYPGFWFAVMLLYPLLSALAQEIVFRAFFAYRFEDVIVNRRLFLVSNALLFSYIHGVFGNPVAVVLSFLGSLLFMSTYLETRSLSMSTLEHALYGNLIFTLGIGTFFYHGS